jgi:hypothetical protein
MDKRILPEERDDDGACRSCTRRHIHQDHCIELKPRWKERNDKLRANTESPVWKVYLCEQCGVPLMGLKHKCRVTLGGADGTASTL